MRAHGPCCVAIWVAVRGLVAGRGRLLSVIWLWCSLVWEEFFEKLKKNNQWHVEVY